jgi:LuxR family transcriptional regulator, maltose regulon positive regulatory protein
MSAPILATKLYVPPPRPKVVLRPRLVERLNEGLHTKLTLISAPAGFGKTTLASEWVASCERPEPRVRVAWLSLDEADNDPARFLTYLVAALGRIAANIGEGVLGALQSPQPPPIEPILTSLLNEITSLPDNSVLVLDDYHVIDAKPVDDALSFLLEHLPAQMHLVIATREDPQLPLARLRGRAQLTELRAADLRFTPAEAADFLNETMGLDLSAEGIAALETRTEGWIAGLQLAAISMQGHKDAASFIKSFSGSHHFVMDYLVDEVLQQQSESVQTFLLQTSILDRLCGPLCDEVVGTFEGWNVSTLPPRDREDPSHASDQSSNMVTFKRSNEILEYLERANLLVVPLDDKREWYRYHHLFADVLQARLMKEQPNQVAGLHLRACAWCEQNNFRADAIRHALAARDFERAADLIELERSVNRGTYFRSATWLGWVKALPDELVQSRPRLSVGFAWELLFLGKLEAAEARMRDADRSLELTADIDDPSESPSTSMAVVNEEEFRTLRASLAIAWAFHAQALGDVAGTEKHARRALTLVSEADYHTRGVAGSLLGLARLTSGDLESAHRYIADGMANLQMTGNLLFANSGTYVLADIRIAQGRLFDAASIYEEALQLVAAQGEPVLQGTAELYLGLSELYHEWGNPEAARQHLMRSEELGELAALPDWPYPLYLVQARIKEAHGDLDGALELLDKAERLYHRGPVPNVRPIAALKTGVWLGQGRLAEALGWAHRRDLSVDDELSYLREFEHITLARVLIACYKSDRAERSIHEAVGLLERLLKAAEEGGRMGSAIEILVLQALAHEAQGDSPLALVPLERALTLAEPEGYVRVFVDEGIPMALLLTRMGVGRNSGKGARMKKYIHKLLAAFGKQVDVHPSSLSRQPLIEPLSQREFEVLELIAQGLSNREIGERLFLALDTVKGHNRNIFDKLQVQRRTEAVARARELGLL